MIHPSREHNIPNNSRGPSRISNLNAGLTVVPPAQVSTTTPVSLPPDIVFARKERINKDLVALFQRPAPRPNFTPSITNPPFLKGIGLYTHAEIPPPHPEAILQTKFIPLGGLGSKTRKAGLQSYLPDDVKALYEKVKDAVTQEVKDIGKAEQLDPREKYGVLGQPECMIPHPPTPTMGEEDKGSEDMDIDRSEDREPDEQPRNSGSGVAERRPSLGGDMQKLSVSGKGKPSTSGDVTMDGTEASSSKTAARIPGSATQKPSDSPVNAAAAPNTSVTIVDANRDPRRRARRGG